MISDISFNGMTVNPKSRFEHLCKIEDHLSTRTDQKLEWGCHHIGRKVSYVK